MTENQYALFVLIAFVALLAFVIVGAPAIP